MKKFNRMQACYRIVFFMVAPFLLIDIFMRIKKSLLYVSIYERPSIFTFLPDFVLKHFDEDLFLPNIYQIFHDEERY